jgi:hypothetical protein
LTAEVPVVTVGEDGLSLKTEKKKIIAYYQIIPGQTGERMKCRFGCRQKLLMLN